MSQWKSAFKQKNSQLFCPFAKVLRHEKLFFGRFAKVYAFWLAKVYAPKVSVKFWNFLSIWIVRLQSKYMVLLLNGYIVLCRLLRDMNLLGHYVFEERGAVVMKGKSEPMITYFLSQPASYRQTNVFYNQDFATQSYIHGMNVNESANPVLTTSTGAGGGNFTLNRSRTNSGTGNTIRSKSASMRSTRFNTPG